jgi:DNA-binding transcriptional MerR regulator
MSAVLALSDIRTYMSHPSERNQDAIKAQVTLDIAKTAIEHKIKELKLNIAIKQNHDKTYFRYANAICFVDHAFEYLGKFICVMEDGAMFYNLRIDDIAKVHTLEEFLDKCYDYLYVQCL